LHHKGLEVLETEYSSRMDLPDQLISKPHWDLLTDDSTMMENG
jgi:hypothetical protein